MIEFSSFVPIATFIGVPFAIAFAVIGLERLVRLPQPIVWGIGALLVSAGCSIGLLMASLHYLFSPQHQADNNTLALAWDVLQGFLLFGGGAVLAGLLLIGRSKKVL